MAGKCLKWHSLAGCTTHNCRRSSFHDGLSKPYSANNRKILRLSVQAWAKSALSAGQALREPAPLFKKLDESVVEEEYARLAG
jgi:hypothetical protein